MAEELSENTSRLSNVDISFLQTLITERVKVVRTFDRPKVGKA